MQSKLVQKLTQYEYWPWYALFLPLIPIYFYGVLRTRKLLYFTATNPSIYMGGFFGERKDDILDLIPNEHKVISILIDNESKDLIEDKMIESKLKFPVIAKPNIGERGKGVKIIHNKEEMNQYARSEDEFLIQEYVDYPLELGVMYCEYPNSERGFVSSITEKRFLSVIGDGILTVDELLQAHPRGRLYLDKFRLEYPNRMMIIPKEDEEYVVHRIGNHAKGTQFLNGNKNLSTQLDVVFTNLNKSVEGVYYGRYDLKVPSYEDLKDGRNIKIFEMNGVSSEPGHIYDQRSVFHAYRDLARHWLIILRIAIENIKKGAKTTPLKTFITEMKSHFFGNN